MPRKFKIFGLSFVAIVATSVLVTTGAQATQVHVNHNGNVSIFGSQSGVQHVFTTNAGTVKCTSAVFETTLANASSQATASELTVTPTYTGCQAFGLPATIYMDGCKYTVTGAGMISGRATVDLTGCTGGLRTEIVTAVCVISVSNQHLLNHVGFAQSGEKVEMTATATGIIYQSQGPLCPTMPTGQTLSNGTYIGQATFQAKVDAGADEATHNFHKYNKLRQSGAAKAMTIT